MQKKNKQPVSFKITKSPQHALLVQLDEGDAFYPQLHYHPEFQISTVLKGEGVLYAGNKMSNFSAKEVLLIGSNVPHVLRNRKPGNKEGVKGISLFFDWLSFGKQFFEVREMFAIKSLLLDSNRVIKISGSNKEVISNKIAGCYGLKNEKLVVQFLEILSLLQASEKEYLNSRHYELKLDQEEGRRLDDVLAFTFKNSTREISIEQVAAVACLSRSQFSTFFRQHTGKSYIRFLNEFRIENACNLLKEKNFTIEQICYQAGFNNVSNFVRQFKKIKNTTPSAYRKNWLLY